MNSIVYKRLNHLATAILIPLLLSGLTAQKAPSKAPAQNTPQPQVTLPPVDIDTGLTLHHLNQIISWYRHATTGIRSVGLPSDAIYEENTRNLGAQAVRLGFQSAKAESALLAAQQKESPDAHPSGQSTQAQNLARIKANTSTRIDTLQAQIEDLNGKIAKAAGKHRLNFIVQRDALQSQLDMQRARLDAIQKMTTFLETTGENAGGFEGDIDRLAKSIPEVLGGPENAKITAAPAPQAKSNFSNAGGLISEAITLYDYMTAEHQIDNLIKETDYTRAVTDQVRKPLRDALRSTIQQSQRLGTQTDVTDAQQLQTQRETFRALTERFKQLSAALMPLSQEVIILDDTKTNFNEWRTSISRESRHVLRSVLFRVIVILIAMALILGLSEIWRRVTFRYVGDPRRRRQFLVLRRVIIGFLFVIVLVLGFVSEFSSLATFAGFITAGLAVGLQAVLLSVAAYFFIIGRYGIRVGDRISVAGITGDVVDIGLVRLYLMELAGTGVDFYPTGRIVVFSNSVLFQTGTPLFKQIPGTEYSWHEVVVKISPDGNHKATEEKLMAAVKKVYDGYCKEIERQHAGIERRVDIQIETPRPEARLQFSDTGLELLVRYPVDIRRAPDIDEEMTRTVFQLIASDDTMKAAVLGTPKIRSAIKG